MVIAWNGSVMVDIYFFLFTIILLSFPYNIFGVCVALTNAHTLAHWQGTGRETKKGVKYNNCF